MAVAGSPFDTLSHKDPSLESVGASLREQFVSTRRLCLLSDHDIHIHRWRRSL